MPPREGRPALNAWIQDAGSWEKVGPVLKAVVELVNREDPVAVGVCLLWRFVRQGADVPRSGIWILLWGEKALAGFAQGLL